MKLKRLLRKFAKEHDFGMLTDEVITQIAVEYFSLYQCDTIIRDIANINRLTEYSLDYNDYESDDYIFVKFDTEGELYNRVKDIIGFLIEQGMY